MIEVLFEKNDKISLSAANNIQVAIQDELHRWAKDKKTERLWKGDATLWTNDGESEWLGWLNIAKQELQELPEIENLKKKIIDSDFTDIVVLGMGGSSLCPALLAETFGKIDSFPCLHVLDSTDPMQIRNLEKQINLKKTLFIVSSKSGGTLEPNCFKEYFYSALQTLLNKVDVGDRFLAITDPKTKLESLAKQDHFRAIFYGEPSIGGRYSALSNFGMVPGVLMGLNIQDFLKEALVALKLCSASRVAQENPGVLLGVILGVCAKLGRDKITFVVSPGIQALGAWLEQLLAESTGKEGKGLIPVDQEPLGEPACYGKDRVFVYISLEDSSNKEQENKIQQLEKAGQVVIRVKLDNQYQLGAELFLWEFATAVAGSVMGVNPFNQPDVEGSKVLAAKLLKEYEKTGKMQKPKLLFSQDLIQLFTDDENAEEINALLKAEKDPLSLAQYLKAHLARIQNGDYLNLSAFLAMTKENHIWLQKTRQLIRDKKKIATCLGFGPRFLHSTGQAYKGGPNTGVFLQITTEHREDLIIPNRVYTFGIVIDAQAEADFMELVKRKRRLLRIHLLGKDPVLGLKQLYDNISKTS